MTTNNQQDDKMRVEFELAAQECGIVDHQYPFRISQYRTREYTNYDVQAAWKLWQAALASREQPATTTEESRNDGVAEQPAALIEAVIKEIDRLGAMTPGEIEKDDIGFYELLDMALTLRFALSTNAPKNLSFAEKQAKGILDAIMPISPENTGEREPDQSPAPDETEEFRSVMGHLNEEVQTVLKERDGLIKEVLHLRNIIQSHSVGQVAGLSEDKILAHHRTMGAENSAPEEANSALAAKAVKVGEEILPNIGDGRIWDGNKWLKICPSMETHAMLQLERERDQLRAENARLRLAGTCLLNVTMYKHHPAESQYMIDALSKPATA